jgi:predicted nuclease of predicted toxin-antitoxin system
MRILLDECVPRRLRRELSGHDVETVPEMGWASLENRALLEIASGKFDILLTTDQRLSYQQTVSDYAIAVVVLVARRNKLEMLLPLLPELRIVISQVKPGEVRRVGG